MKEKLEILKSTTGQWSSNKTIFSEEKPKVLATKMSEKKDFSSNFMNYLESNETIFTSQKFAIASTVQ